MKLFKNIAFFFLLSSRLSIYSQSFDSQINDELSIDIYRKDEDELQVRKMLTDFYQVANHIKLSAEDNERLKNLVQNQFYKDIDVSLVLLNKDKVIGACSYDLDEKNKDGHLYMIVIDKDYRGQGFAEKFLLKIIDLHKHFDMKTISLSAHPVINSAAIKLYKKVGFEKIGMNPKNQSLEEFKKIL